MILSSYHIRYNLTYLLSMCIIMISGVSIAMITIKFNMFVNNTSYMFTIITLLSLCCVWVISAYINLYTERVIK